MKKITLLFIFLFSMYAFSQDETEVVPYAVIENVPVYKGCNENLSNTATKKCMNEKIIALVSKNFNTGKAKGLGLSGRVQVSVVFKVDKDGSIIDIRSRAPHPELEKEAIRVIKLIPKMERPGIQRGKPVIVPYSLPIMFDVVDKPLSKKERRKLKRQKKN